MPAIMAWEVHGWPKRIGAGSPLWSLVQGGLALERRDGVDDGLGFLELGDGQGPAQAADAALLEATLGEAVVDRRPRVGPDGAGLELAADPSAGVEVAGEDAGREAVFGGVGAGDGVGLGVEDLEGRDRAERFLLHDVGGDVLDLEQGGPVE